MKSRPLIGSTTILLVLLSMAGCREPNVDPRLAENAKETAAATGAPAASPPATAQPEGELRPANLCNIEYIAETAFGGDAVPISGPAVVRGWLADESGQPESPQLLVADDNKQVVARYPLTLDVDRPDVVQAFPGRVKLEKSGFKAEVHPEALGAQAYHLYLIYNFKGGSFVCDNGRRISVSK